MGVQRARPSYEILSGATGDVYFARATSILEREGLDPVVTMEVFCRRDAVLCGIGEATNLLGHVLNNEPGAIVEALEDGDRVTPKEVVLRIQARYRAFALYETAILGMLAQSTGWATAARECVDAAAPHPVISFGARHVHPDITDVLDYAAIVGGCVGASTPAGARLAGLNPTGTMPHSLVLIFGDTVRASEAFDRDMPPDVPRIVLVDTFKDEAEEALRVAHALGDRLYGIRLDTPSERGRVTAALVTEVRARLDQAGLPARDDHRVGRADPGPDPVLPRRGRPGRFLRRRLVHLGRHADRLHRRHQGDRRLADRQARPDPGSHGQPAPAPARPRAVARPGGRIGLADGLVRDLRPEAGSRVPWQDRPMVADPRTTSPPTSCSSGAPRCSQRRHHAQAAIVLERAARLEPGKGSILEALGRAYFNSAQHERARETFEALLEVDPSSRYGHFALGQSLKRLGRTREARTHLRLAVALEPRLGAVPRRARAPAGRQEPAS